MPPRFIAAVDKPDAAKAAPARDPAAWREQVAAELEQVISARRAAPATAFPDLRRPGPPARKRSAGGVIALAVVAGLAGVAIGAALPSGFRLQTLLPAMRRAPILLAEARLEPVGAPEAVRTAPVAAVGPLAAPKPAAAPALKPAQPAPTIASAAAAAPASAPVPTPGAAPRQRRAADPGLTAALSDEEVILEAAYREASQAGVPAALLRANRAEWRVVRAGAAQQSRDALLDAYEARIEEIHTMADEAWRAQTLADQRAAAALDRP